MTETTVYSLQKRQVWNKHQEMIKSSAMPIYCGVFRSLYIHMDARNPTPKTKNSIIELLKISR